MSKNQLSILFCGDVMPGGVLPYQESYINNEMLSYMQGFDLRIGTLECAIGTNLKPAPEKLKQNGGNDNICFARDEDFFRIKELGFDAMSIGNNHSFDLGEHGLINTIHHLQDNGIGYFGAGLNKHEASKPYIIEKKGKTICVIGCCIKGLSPKSLIVATDDSYGVYQPTIDELIRQIKNIKEKYDYVVIMPHWGEEHVRVPPVQNVQYARRMLDAGADAIFGSHSHCLAPHVVYKGKPIYYGMGNFLDPDKCLTPPRPFYYPKNKEELESLRKCINYPWSVKQPTLCINGDDTRLGLAVEAYFGDAIKTNNRIVKLGHDNVLRSDDQNTRLKDRVFRKLIMPMTGWATKSKLYKYFYSAVFIYEKRIRNLGDFRKDI